jgi:hypothetical protein
MSGSSLINMFDLSGKATAQYAAGGSFADKFGESLFKTDNQRKLQEYADNDMAMVSAMRMRNLEKIAAETTDMSDSSLETGTGMRRNLVAKGVDDQFRTMDGLQFRVQASGFMKA